MTLVGARVYHPKLGYGVIIELKKYNGVMVDFSNSSGVLVRVCHLSSLEIIDE